jgi:hypothetical protein
MTDRRQAGYAYCGALPARSAGALLFEGVVLAQQVGVRGDGHAQSSTVT